MRVCRRCSKEQPDKAFRSYEAQGYFCVRTHCRPCEREIAREKYKAAMAVPGAREKARAYDAAYRKKHRKRIRARMRTYMAAWRADKAALAQEQQP